MADLPYYKSFITVLILQIGTRQIIQRCCIMQHVHKTSYSETVFYSIQYCVGAKQCQAIILSLSDLGIGFLFASSS